MNEGNIPGKNEALISLILGIAGLVVSSRSKSMGYNDSLRTRLLVRASRI